MQIRIFQIIVPLIAAIFLIGLATGYRKGKLNLRELLLSVIFWVGAACLALFPDVISNFVAEVFGIKSNVNAVIFLSIGVIVYLQFVLYAEIKRNRRLLTTLTRELALRDAKKKPEA